MKKTIYIIYCILFFLGINSYFFFLLYGFLLLYDFSSPFFSEIIDNVIFILVSIITTYLCAILTFWGYNGIRKQKRNISIVPFSDAFSLNTHFLPLFFMTSIFFGYFYDPIYKPQSSDLGILILFTAVFYISLISLCYLIATTIYQAELLEKEFDDILKKNNYNIIGMIVGLAGILLFLFVVLTIVFAFIYLIFPDLNSFIIYEIFFILFYPVFTIGIIVIMFKRSKRVAVDFLFIDKLMEGSKLH